MENKETFKMTYSAEQQAEVEAIRKKYAPQKEDKMAQLRALDAKATNKATTVSLAVGILGAIIMGMGMSLIMTDFGALLGSAAFPVGLVLGVLGMGILTVAYPLYNRTLKREREKIAPEILRLSDELMQ